MGKKGFSMDLTNENVIHVKKEGIEYLQFRKLLEYSDTISHAYVLGLDKNFRTGLANDEEMPIEEFNKAVSSYKSVCNALNLNYNNLIKQQQAHTKNVAIVEGKEDLNNPDFLRIC